MQAVFLIWQMAIMTVQQDSVNALLFNHPRQTDIHGNRQQTVLQHLEHRRLLHQSCAETRLACQGRNPCDQEMLHHRHQCYAVLCLRRVRTLTAMQRLLEDLILTPSWLHLISLIVVWKFLSLEPLKRRRRKFCSHNNRRLILHRDRLASVA